MHYALFAVLLVLAVFGFLFVILAVQALIGMSVLMRTRFAPSGGRTVAAQDELPEDERALFDAAGAALARLGFEYVDTARTRPLSVLAVEPHAWSQLYFHPEHRTWARVLPAGMPEPGLLTDIIFNTVARSHLVQTVNRHAHHLLPARELFEIEDALAPTLAAHWARHLMRIGPLQEHIDARREALDAFDEWTDARGFEFWRASGTMQPAGEHWRLTWRGAARHWWQLVSGMRRIAKLPPMQHEDPPALCMQADVRAIRLHELGRERMQLSLRAKAAWFFATAALGALAFGALLSWRMVPMLFGVLLFHEFGHALAMRAVGYRGLHVFVLPFLGAVAVGRKDDAGPMQKLFVLLAGPLPGLVLAVVCVRYAIAHPAPGQFLLTLGLVALVLNLFNLLPFTPLDGGQIVDTFAFSGRPWARFGFYVLSALALIGAGVLLRSPVLAAAAVVLLAFSRSAWRRAQLVRGLTPSSSPEVTILQRVYGGARVPGFNRRLMLVRMLRPELVARRPRALERVLGLLAYACVVVVPVAALWDTGVPQNLLAAVFSSEQEAEPRALATPDWSAQLAQAPTPQARWQVRYDAALWYADNANDDDAAVLTQCDAALVEAQAMPAGTERDIAVLRTQLLRVWRIDATQARGIFEEQLVVARQLPQRERHYAALVLEEYDRWDHATDDAQRIAHLSEAVAHRQAAAIPHDLALYDDRAELARLYDRRADTAAGTDLIVQNALELTADPFEAAVGQWDTIAWYLIAHDQATTAYALTRTQFGQATENATRSRGYFAHLYAWTALARGMSDEALDVLDAQWSDQALPMQRLDDAIDLAYASGRSPQIQARWLREARLARDALTPQARALFDLNLQVAAADVHAWDHLRAQARVDILARLKAEQP